MKMKRTTVLKTAHVEGKCDHCGEDCAEDDMNVFVSADDKTQSLHLCDGCTIVLDPARELR